MCFGRDRGISGEGHRLMRKCTFHHFGRFTFRKTRPRSTYAVLLLMPALQAYACAGESTRVAAPADLASTAARAAAFLAEEQALTDSFMPLVRPIVNSFDS